MIVLGYIWLLAIVYQGNGIQYYGGHDHGDMGHVVRHVLSQMVEDGSFWADPFIVMHAHVS